MAASSTILCVSSYFKGNRFLKRCKREGCRVILLTAEDKLGEPWARDHLDEVFALPSFADRRAVLNAVAFLMRSATIDCLVALDDFDVELVAFLREHFRKPGMGETTARYFRDKLAMRAKARDLGLPIPEYVGTIHHDEVRRFLANVPPPWLLKPRGAASAMGIRKYSHPDEVWQYLEQLGDDQSFFLLEKMIPSDVFHVDALVNEREVVFAEVGRYSRPLLDVYQGGGIFSSHTIPRENAEVGVLRDLNEKVLQGFGLVRGAAHTEFLRDRTTGAFYFLETSSRVGGANIIDMVEAATGLNLWEEWAMIEINAGLPYKLPRLREEYAGVIVSLARQERPDTSSFNDPEIFHRVDLKHHIGFVVRSPSLDRVEFLLKDYRERIERDFHAVSPPSDKAVH